MWLVTDNRFTCSLKAHQWRHGAGSRPAARGQRLWEWWRNGPPSAPSWGRRSASWCRWSPLLSAGLSAYDTSDLAPPAGWGNVTEDIWRHLFMHMCVSVCVFLPGEYRSLWQGFPLFPLWVWLSFLSAVSRSAPRPPPSSHQTRTGKKNRKRNTTSHTPTLLTHMNTVTTCTHLRVLQEGGLVIDAATWSVAEGVLAVDPRAPHHLLLPSFVDTQVGGVDEAAQDQVSEVLAEVVERHPAGGQEKERREETGQSGYRLEGKAWKKKTFNR